MQHTMNNKPRMFVLQNCKTMFGYFLTWVWKSEITSLEIPLNLCNMFFPFNVQWILFICIIIINQLRWRRAVIFMKYLACAVSLFFLRKTLIWNKMSFPASNLLNLPELVSNELKKVISTNICQYWFFLWNFHCLM